MKFVSFILEHVAKVLFFTNDFFARDIILKLAEKFAQYGA